MRDSSDRAASADVDSRCYERILGVRFLDGSVHEAIAAIRHGGLMVVPAAPGLVTLPDDATYREALQRADFALVDSTYLALLWLAASGRMLHRVSGLQFLRAFLGTSEARPTGALLLVNPGDEEGRANLELLRSMGFSINASHCYAAPHYRHGTVEDPELLRRIEALRPRYVMINLGGGTQEQLGLYLKKHLSYLPGILCTGAAIAFLTGRQASIPVWADRIGVGWLLRILDDPRRFAPRYAGAARLARLIFHYRSKMPNVPASDETGVTS